MGVKGPLWEKVHSLPWTTLFSQSLNRSLLRTSSVSPLHWFSLLLTVIKTYISSWHKKIFPHFYCYFFFFFYWCIAVLQCCINLCPTAKWFSYTHIHSFLYSLPLWLITGYWMVHGVSRVWHDLATKPSPFFFIFFIIMVNQRILNIVHCHTLGPCHFSPLF